MEANRHQDLARFQAPPGSVLVGCWDVSVVGRWAHSVVVRAWSWVSLECVLATPVLPVAQKYLLDRER